MYECDWWKLYNTNNIVKQHQRESFLYKLPLREGRLLENHKKGRTFIYFECDTEVPENPRGNFANFPPIFDIIKTSRDDIGSHLKANAEREAVLTPPRRKLISKYLVENAAIITH